MDTHAHPRYRGPVIDVHVHYCTESRSHARDVNRTGGLASAIQLWDLTWPPPRYDEELDAWRALEPGLMRCHVPDLSAVGDPEFERRVAVELQEAASLGCVGLKVWKNLGLKLTDTAGRRLAVDDPRLDVLWTTAAELELPVLIHVGDPPGMWEPRTPENPYAKDAFPKSGWCSGWWYSDGDHPALAQIHEEFERVVSGHRATTFVGAHFGCFLSTSELDRWLGTYPNFHFDTAAAISEIGHGDVQAAREIFLNWPDRALFGTDLGRVPDFEYPDFGAQRWDLAEYFALHWRFFETAERELPHPLPEKVPWTVTGIDLPDEVLRALYVENAMRLYRLPLAQHETALQPLNHSL
jgi:predicted TIM-barrel fold metal-dependent hydrolase